MAYFPFFVDVKDKKCCIIGGGIVALRKVEALLQFEADITVISPAICEELLRYGHVIQLINRAFVEHDLEGAWFVIAATNQPELNARIAWLCREKNILVNAVDEKENCDFLFPAFVKKGDISIGITTSGQSPVMAAHIKKQVSDQLPGYYEELAVTLGHLRVYVKGQVAKEHLRSEIFKELFETGRKQLGKITIQEVDRIISRHLKENGEKI